MIFAIVPWDSDFEKDQMFNINSSLNRDFMLNPYRNMKERFEELGHCIHTMDWFEEINVVDFFLLFSLDWKAISKIRKAGKQNKIVYCTAEPPSVHWYNTLEGYKLLRHIFPYILSWNPNLVDNKSVFLRNIPYHFVDLRKGNKDFNKKKLLVLISSNRYSDYEGELYSERRKVIEYFEKNHPDDFAFYGKDWNESEYTCYRGIAPDKSEIYHNYRFSICLENTEGLEGYITEKILDCFTMGIVPIYAGAPDVNKYVPQEAYISYRDFLSFEELYEYIVSISEEEYKTFLFHADKYLSKNRHDFFTGSRYADLILEAVKHKPPYNNNIIIQFLFRLLFFKKKIFVKLKSFMHKYINL